MSLFLQPYILPEAARIAIGDGTYKLAMLINGRLPGPPIVVYEGQEVGFYNINRISTFCILFLYCRIQ